jgi:hypothetical protein
LEISFDFGLLGRSWELAYRRIQQPIPCSSENREFYLLDQGIHHPEQGIARPTGCVQAALSCTSLQFGGRLRKIGHRSRLQKFETEWALAGRVKNGRSCLSHAAIALALEASNSSADHAADAGHPFGSFDGGAALIGTYGYNIGLVLFCQSFQPDNFVSTRVLRVTVAHQLSGLLPPKGYLL